MKNTMKYKAYTGSVAFDAEDRIFHGGFSERCR